MHRSSIGSRTECCRQGQNSKACFTMLLKSHAKAALFDVVKERGRNTGWKAASGLCRLLPGTTAMFQAASMLAPDGRCKALDASADGYVRSEALVMALLSAAPPGKDAAPPEQPMAILAGTSVNQDGRSSALTAPNGPAQQNCHQLFSRSVYSTPFLKQGSPLKKGAVKEALAVAGLEGSQLAGLQMHGTGTSLGDPIEVGAAMEQLHTAPQDVHNKQHAAVHLLAAKSIVGHAEPASGLLGLMYAVQQCKDPAKEFAYTMVAQGWDLTPEFLSNPQFIEQHSLQSTKY
eukprot:1154291-Pelagomonas_calceolata.AAC.16